MSQKLVSFELSSQESFYYSALKKYGETGYDDAEHWPVEKYDDSQKTIIFKKVEASIDDVLEFAKLLQRWLISACERLKKIDSKEEHRQLIKKDNIEFVVEGTAEYTFSGENCRFRIEVKGEAITIQQSDNYIFFGSMYFSDYEKFCDTKTIICDDLSKLCSKEEFNPTCEHYVTHDKLYVDEFPPYGKKTPADKHMKAGVIYSFDDTTAKKISNGESLEDEKKAERSANENVETSSQQPPKTITLQQKAASDTPTAEKAKSSSSRQHTDQESLQIKRELKKVLSSGQVITISEMQAQSSFLSKYTNFKLSGMLREMREIGEIDKIYDYMKNACYGTPAAIERVRPEIEKEIARREEVRKAKEEERVAEENRQRERVFRDADNALKSYSKQSVQKSISDLEKLPDKKDVPDKIRALNRRLDELEAEERQKQQEEERKKQANKTKTTIVIVGMIVVIVAILFFFM